MRPHSPAEAEFAKTFGERLRPHYERAKRERKLTLLAKTLGVTAPALDKYVKGVTMPGINTMVLAYRQLAIAVPFEGVDLAKLLHRRVGRKRPSSLSQLSFPFMLQAI